MRRIPLAPLTAEAFAPFGNVIDRDQDCERMAINDGRTERLHQLAAVDCAAERGSAAISLFRAQPVDDSFLLQRMERHPLGSQAFINISGNPYAVVVAPAGDLDEAAICAFLATPQQSVSYHRGVWHHYLLALSAPSEFVVVDRVGPGSNCDEMPLKTALQLALPA